MAVWFKALLQEARGNQLVFFYVNNTCTLASLLLASHKENNDCRHKNNLAKKILMGRLKSFCPEMMNCETNMVVNFLLPLAALLPMDFCQYRSVLYLFNSTSYFCTLLHILPVYLLRFHFFFCVCKLKTFKKSLCFQTINKRSWIFNQTSSSACTQH